MEHAHLRLTAAPLPPLPLVLLTSMVS